MSLAKRLSWMFLGYGAAVITATFIAVVLLTLMGDILAKSQLASIQSLFMSMLQIMLFGLLITVLFAFPGWLAFAALAEFKAIHFKSYFIVAGALNALIAIWLVELTSAQSFQSSFNFGAVGTVLIWPVIGGAFGGWAYWRVAVKRFGKWRVQA